MLLRLRPGDTKGLLRRLAVELLQPRLMLRLNLLVHDSCSITALEERHRCRTDERPGITDKKT